MKNSVQELFIGIPITSPANPVQRRPSRLLLDNVAIQSYVPTLANKSLAVKQDKIDSVLKKINMLGRKADKFAHGIREHVKLGTKITETLKGKLSLGAKILKVGGVKKIFRQFFTITEGERLLKACQCYLSTTAGPIAGLLFISNEKIAFCSERSIKLSSPEGKMARIHYKAVIPLNKIKTANQSENVKKPSQKFIEIMTVDDFDFWFMGFLNNQKAFKCLQQAISQAGMSTATSHLN
ncbi:putative GEM-like protein 8 [Mercurialis annua]|uniref:putative GEM-like protein 8 n=1 Tax=Mercurialis annua TaxID=3986 RepID=UPI00215FE093|nr:putative GEM-like protein 8 [Mercurialis annua]